MGPLVVAARAFLAASQLPLPQRRRELRPGPNPELAVGPGEVGFDGLLGDEQGLGDLGVGETVRGHLGDPALARGKALRGVRPPKEEAG